MASSTRISVRRVPRCCAASPVWICTLAISRYQSQILVPDELVDGVGDVVEAVLGEALARRRLPRAAAREMIQRSAWLKLSSRGRAAGLASPCVLAQAAVLAFAIHQHEARGVPELVAEVAVALAALGVEVDVAAQRGQRGEGEAQRVGAEGRGCPRGIPSRCSCAPWARSRACAGRWCACPAAARARCRRSGRPGRARCLRTCSSSCRAHRAPGRGCRRGGRAPGR